MDFADSTLSLALHAPLRQFMAALVLIYGLIVWEFRNFALAGLIMSPIPLTLISFPSSRRSFPLRSPDPKGPP